MGRRTSNSSGFDSDIFPALVYPYLTMTCTLQNFVFFSCCAAVRCARSVANKRVSDVNDAELPHLEGLSRNIALNPSIRHTLAYLFLRLVGVGRCSLLLRLYQSFFFVGLCTPGHREIVLGRCDNKCHVSLQVHSSLTFCRNEIDCGTTRIRSRGSNLFSSTLIYDYD